MSIEQVVQLVQSIPVLVLSLILLKREMQKREEAEHREREILRALSKLPPEGLTNGDI